MLHQSLVPLERRADDHPIISKDYRYLPKVAEAVAVPEEEEEAAEPAPAVVAVVAAGAAQAAVLASAAVKEAASTRVAAMAEA